jgi:hypothetical protein
VPFYALFALLAGLTIVVNTNRTYFYTLIDNLKDHRFAHISSQEQLFMGSLSAFFFDILFFIATSLLAYRMLDFYKIPLYIGDKLLTVFEILMILLVFYLSKNILYRVLGYLFGIKKEISEYLYQISGFNRISGIALVPLLFLSFYSQSQGYVVILVLMLGILSVSFFLRYVRGIRIAAHVIKNNPFFAFIFVVGIEILPLCCITKTLIA